MKYLTTFLLSMCLVLISCGDDDGSIDDCNSTSFSAEFQQEINNISAAASAYANDPSNDNCDDLKDAYNDYIDALEEWENCANALWQETEWEEALEESRAAVDSIC